MKKAKIARGIERIFGLMFKTKRTPPLVFEFKKDVHISIHSLFVFFPFHAIWLDENNRIIEQRVIRPFSVFIKPKKPFRKIIEIPIQ